MCSKKKFNSRLL